MPHFRSIFADGLFSEKVAIVTGGGTGIGKAIASELVRLGASVVIAARNLERLEKAALEICDENGIPKQRVLPVRCNVRSEEDVRLLMRATVEKFGAIHFLVNNAGGQFPSPAEQIRTKGWLSVVELNLTATFLCCREAHAAYMGQYGGAIVNVVADMWRGFPGMAHTGAARAGTVNLAQTLAVEWATAGIRVNCVAPGYIYSETAVANYPHPDLLNGQSHVTPAKRLGTVHEVAAAVAFLLSPGAAYITGTCLKVDGGSSLWGSSWVVPQHNALAEYGDLLPPEAKGQAQLLPFAEIASKL
eukprot:TRINITY_DN2659_c1_g1_i1.p1 TRINITY_DN2659_c1_g1~~TRINITY_DN2659_c1_g1_i1.p1  ORF type:complete len:302 (-),score=42.75 TRINITY_DN2659_c1_g1_i1:8-913(-)